MGNVFRVLYNIWTEILFPLIFDHSQCSGLNSRGCDLKLGCYRRLVSIEALVCISGFFDAFERFVLVGWSGVVAVNEFPLQGQRCGGGVETRTSKAVTTQTILTTLRNSGTTIRGLLREPTFFSFSNLLKVFSHSLSQLTPGLDHCPVFPGRAHVFWTSARFPRVFVSQLASHVLRISNH